MGSQTTYQVLLSKEKTYPSRKSFLLSWIWISSSTTRRNADNWGIFGDEDVECVRLGNQVAARWALLALVCTIMNIFWVVPVPELHREDLFEGIYNQLYDGIYLLFLLLDPTAGWFPRVVSRSMGVPQNGLLLKLIIGQFSWGGAATKFMPTGLPICFPCIAQLVPSCIFQKNVDGDFRALVC